MYPFLRHVFGQIDGPNVTTLLAILPRDYLETIHLVLCGMTGSLAARDANAADPGEHRRAA